MDLWRVTLTVEVEAENHEDAIRAACRLDDSVICSSAERLDLEAELRWHIINYHKSADKPEHDEGE
jgi:hypothetical protein